MQRDAECDSRPKRDNDSGSIGIGAMIVFIALILVAAVASTIIIKTAEELQQNAESTSQDTRDQISGKISIMDVYIESSANPLLVDNDGSADNTGDSDTDAATFDVIARVSSGSLNVQEGDITWYITCKVAYTTWTDSVGGGAPATEALDGTTFAVVDTALVDIRALSEPFTGGEGDATDATYNTGDDITAGTTFHFQIDLGATNKDVDGALNENIDAADFAATSGGTNPGCDAEAGAGQQLGLRVVVNGGGETLATLKVSSITLGKSVM